MPRTPSHDSNLHGLDREDLVLRQLRQVADTALLEVGDDWSREAVDRLIDGLIASTRGADPGPVGVRADARLLVLLRAHLVALWRSGDPEVPSGLDVLVLMQAFDRVGSRLGIHNWEAHLDSDRSFVDWLSQPTGLELVVEVAHDLRSPLTSILFLAETLQREQSGPINDLQRRQLGLVYSAALGLSTLASNVMELARGGTRLADDRPVPFSIADVLESVADIVRPMAEEKGLSVKILPPKADHRTGPAQALSRVLLNLTTNAIKFTEDGFVEVTARATSLEEIEFSVRDSGHGITPETSDTLFQPFRRGPSGSDMRFSGTGLGLALCRRLVEAMGSELEFESDPQWGTRFYFTLQLPAA